MKKYKRGKGILSPVESLMKIWSFDWRENQMTRATQYLNGKTEFGKGFILCLARFTEHAERFDNMPEGWYRRHKIEEWFRDAGQHLEMLEIPKCFKNTKVEELVKDLKKLSNGSWLRAKEEDIDKAIHLVHLIAMEVDKHLGLNPDVGKH